MPCGIKERPLLLTPIITSTTPPNSDSPRRLQIRTDLQSGKSDGHHHDQAWTSDNALVVQLPFALMATPLRHRRTLSPSTIKRSAAQPPSYDELITPSLVLGDEPFPSRSQPHSFRSSSVPISASASASAAKKNSSGRDWTAMIITSVYALSLMLAVGVRANLVSLGYLICLCVGFLRYFASRSLVSASLLLALAAWIAHVVCVVIVSEGETPSTIVKLFGMQHMHTTTQYLSGLGADVLVFFMSAIQLWNVARYRRRINTQRSLGVDSLGPMNSTQQVNASILRHKRNVATQKYLDLVCSMLLFCTALSLPAFATGLYYLVLLERLARWTWGVKKISIDDLIHSKSKSTLFLSSVVTKLLMFLSVLVINLWYVFQLDNVNSNSSVSEAGHDLGFIDFRGSGVKWSHCVFAACQCLLFIACAHLEKLRQTIRVDEELLRQHPLANPFSPIEEDEEDVEGATMLLHPTNRPKRATSEGLLALIRRQPFFVRAFLHEGGSLLASAAAIIWCVSYPSYLSTPLMAWAFLTLALYGLSVPAAIVWVLSIYGTGLALVEYVSNLTIDLVSTTDGHIALGLKVFDFPFLDLGVHNVCLAFIYYSIKTRRQYDDILKACNMYAAEEQAETYRSTGDDRSHSLNDGDRARTSFDTFQQQADLRNQLRAGWKNVASLWATDAKQVILTHLDALVLATILVVALSTSVSFLQIGYLVLAIMLMLFFEYRRRFWRVLLCYALLACLAVFVRNIECGGDETEFTLIGLRCYSTTSVTWGALWPTLFSTQLLIIVQLVFQLVIYVANKETIEERIRTMDQSRQNPIFFLSRLAVEIDNVFRAVGVIICYVAFLVVAIRYERGPTNLNTTVIGGIQLILLFFILGNHLGGFPKAPRTSLRSKVLWFIALLVEMAILVLRYCYQFDQVSDYLKKHVFTTAFISAKDFGLQNHTSGQYASGIFAYLLPTAIVMALCFWQLAALSKEVHPYDWFAAGRSRTVDRMRLGLDVIQQVLISFSTASVVLVALAMAIDNINVIGGLYVVVLIFGRPFSVWSKLWFPLYWISGVAIVLKYLIQLSTFNGDEVTSTTGGKHILFTSSKMNEWLGMVQIADKYPSSTGSSHLWNLIYGQLLVILMCGFQRMSQYFDAFARSRKLHEPRSLDMGLYPSENNYMAHPAILDYGSMGRSSSVIADDDDEDAADRASGYLEYHGESTPVMGGEHSPHDIPKTLARADSTGQTGYTDSSNKEPQHTTRETARMLHTAEATQIDEDKDFFSCLRDFCVGYASKASVNITMLLLTISAFVHADMISVVYMIVVYAMMYAFASTVCKRWWAMAIVLSAVILVEYAFILWLPPTLNIEIQETFPWRVVPESDQRWYLLSNQDKWALFVDFLGLVSVYLLPQSSKITKNDTMSKQSQIIPTIDIPTQSQSRSKSQHGLYDASNFAQQDTEVNEYILLTRKFLWYYLEFAIVSMWLPITLVLVFLLGAETEGILSIVYLWSAVFMLYRLDESRESNSTWIHNLRKWNWAHLFIMILLRAPYFSSDLETCQVGTTTDNPLDSCVTIENIVGLRIDSAPYELIITFVLISIECEIRVSPTYSMVCAYVWRDQEQAQSRHDEIVRAFYKQRTAQWMILKREKSAAVVRLKIIVSKLVHKVEELMDIAMGLHYNLPPMAPAKPSIVDCSQNSVTISWVPPSNTAHKIRYYRISRQQYPSLTLLGDFNDIVEVKGEHIQATIDGLRPGTSYQFKVCAVSRMGEGPFSAASDPIATYPLNLDGSCTAGWMKYRREHVPASRFSFLISWMQPKVLHRYVVMDARQLVFYQNEEIALKHRSRKRRKKMKTSFLWRDVIEFRLSETKVQFDDMSPMLYCFEIIVHREDGDIKYIFQADLTKDFNKFLTTLAFSVPRDTINQNVIDSIMERNLPNPLDVAPPTSADDEVLDENKSDWSSVTGDESSYGDAEDQEFDKDSSRGLLAWRIPLHRLLYSLQNAAFQLESVQYDTEEQYEPSLSELMQLFTNVIRSHSSSICCFVMVLCFVCQGDLLNMVYVFSVFGILMVESPRPQSVFWVYLLKYSYCVITLRYIFQLSPICHKLTTGGIYYPSIQPYCTTAASVTEDDMEQIQPMVLLGLYKFDGSATSSFTTTYAGLQWDFYVILFILWNRREQMLRGLWVESSGQNDAENMNTDSIQGFRTSLSSQDSIDDAFRYSSMNAQHPPAVHTGIMRAPVSKLPSRATSETGSRASRNTGLHDTLGTQSMDSSSVDFTHELAAELLEEIQAEQEEIDRAKAAAMSSNDQTEGDDATEDVATARSVRFQLDPMPPSSHQEGKAPIAKEMNKDEVVSEQVEIDDKSEPGFLNRKKPSWFETKFPLVYEYFEAMTRDPPALWDKDIQVAIMGDKPGRDYYAISLALLLFVSVYAVLFFKLIGEEPSTTTEGEEDSSSSLLSGYMVLLVFLELCVIIWDRVAYVCRSLTAKVTLQYSCIVVLHLTVWFLIPNHTGIYFQQRSALVIFYAVHCIYLWFGALQIRYGYPAFSGSKYNYTNETAYTRLNEKLFPLIMLSPFIFEMRSLLDYVCTKTSLGWAHWILLEDTAAHLFQVKMEMRGRLSDATVLQGKQRQPLARKMLSAGVMLLFLLLCLLAPLWLFSSANPSTSANAITLADVSFGVQDTQGTINELYNNEDINSPSFSDLNKNTDSSSVQSVAFDSFSRTVWSMSPPRVDQLITQLNSSEALNWTMTLSFTRPGPTDYQTISKSYLVDMTSAHRKALITMMQQSNTSNVTPIVVENLLPPVLQLTATSGVLTRSTTLRPVKVAKHTQDSATWWSVEPDNSEEKDDYCGSDTPFCIISVSDNIVQGLTSLGIGTYGITAVYVFVIVTIGNAVKSFFRGKVFQIQYDELPDTEDVLELIEGIYIAREESYVGHLKDEVRIFETLVRVLRSPETLLKVTGTNVIHIPTAKEKQD